jgi:hypothetical protein
MGSKGSSPEVGSLGANGKTARHGRLRINYVLGANSASLTTSLGRCASVIYFLSYRMPSGLSKVL